ncbi:hypothetical protein [Nocardioides ferulae]|uniref:hypothetical protein n=1 Tax=Nocardioides ferulae TaxID=2340821 RepID=UPI000F8843C6|nr:hypothetical protein [Nocardioides ferulae]
MSTPLNSDHQIVLRLTTTTAIGRLQDEGMGPMEAAEFLVESAARHVLGLDGTGRFFPASSVGDMTQILQAAVSGAWEGGFITDEQHDAALTYLNRGEPLHGAS